MSSFTHPHRFGLHFAIEIGNLTGVKSAVALGLPLNEGPDGVPPLLQALNRGRIEIAEYLISKGADARRTGKNGETALILAASKLSCAPLIPKLVEAKAELEAQRGDGFTALAVAVSIGSIEAARYLLEAGAKTDGLFKLSTAPGFKARGSLLHLAVKGIRSRELNALLLKYHADAKALDTEGVGLASLAVQCRTSAEMLDQLLAAGADPNGRDAKGSPALVRAVDRPEMVQVLVTRGANPLLRDAEDKSALDRATNPEVRKILERAIADWRHAETVKRVRNTQSRRPPPGTFL